MLAYQGVQLTRTEAQTISHATETLVSWDAETHDVGEYHDASIQPTQIIVPTDLGGTYNVYASVDWEASGIGYREITIYVNDVAIAQNTRPTYPTELLSQFVSTSWILEEGDIVTIKVYQTSTGGLDVTRSAIRTPRFGIDLLGVEQ